MEEEDGAVLMLMLVLCVLRGASPKGDAKLSFIGFRHKGHRPTSRPTGGGGGVRRVLKLDVRRIGKARAGIRRAAFGGAAAPREGGAEALSGVHWWTVFAMLRCPMEERARVAEE